MPSLETYFWENIQIGDAVVRRRQRNFGIIAFNYHIYSGWGKVGAELWHLHMWGGCVGWRGACPMWNHRGAHFCRAYSEINPSIPRSGGRGRGRVRRWYPHTRAQHSHVAAHTSAAILHPARDVSAYRHVPHGFVCKYMSWAMRTPALTAICSSSWVIPGRGTETRHGGDAALHPHPHLQ